MYAKEKIHGGQEEEVRNFVCDEMRMKRQQKNSSLRLLLEVTGDQQEEDSSESAKILKNRFIF